MSIYVKPWVSAAAQEVITAMNKGLQSVPPAIRQEFFRHCPKFGPVIEAAIAKHAPSEPETRQSMAESVREAVKHVSPPVPVVVAEPKSDLVDSIRSLLKSSNLRLNQIAEKTGQPEAEVLKVLQENPALFELGAKGWWKGR